MFFSFRKINIVDLRKSWLQVKIIYIDVWRSNSGSQLLTKYLYQIVFEILKTTKQFSSPRHARTRQKWQAPDGWHKTFNPYTAGSPSISNAFVPDGGCWSAFLFCCLLVINRMYSWPEIDACRDFKLLGMRLRGIFCW